jgi:HD superfamily phosphodiesterase
MPADLLNALEVVHEIIRRHRLRNATFTLVTHRVGIGWRQRHRTAEQRLEHLADGLATTQPTGWRVSGGELLGLGMEDLDRYRSDQDHVVSISSRLSGTGRRDHLALMDLHLDEFVPLDRVAKAVRTLCDRRASWLLRTDRHYHVYGDFLLDQDEWQRWNLRFQMTAALTSARYIGHSLLWGGNLLRLNAARMYQVIVPVTAREDAGSPPGPIAAAAMQLAQRQHRWQLRKNGEPMMRHLSEVAALALQIRSDCRSLAGDHLDEGSPDELYASGYLHDCIEDTNTDYDKVAGAAGTRVADWVTQLSEDKRQPATHRHVAYRRQIALAGRPARMVKLADLLSNLRGLTGHEGHAWIRSYLTEVDTQLHLIRHGLDQCPAFGEAEELVRGWRGRLETAADPSAAAPAT